VEFKFSRFLSNISSKYGLLWVQAFVKNHSLSPTSLSFYNLLAKPKIKVMFHVHRVLPPGFSQNYFRRLYTMTHTSLYYLPAPIHGVTLRIFPSPRNIKKYEGNMNSIERIMRARIRLVKLFTGTSLPAHKKQKIQKFMNCITFQTILGSSSNTTL